MTRKKQFIIVAVASVVMIGGCQALQEVLEPKATRSLLDESNALIISMETRANEQDMRIAAMEEGAAKTTDMIALVDSRATIAEIKKVQDELEKYVDEQGNIDTGGLLTAITTAIPPPYNVFFGIGIGGITDWWRNRKTRTAFGRLVNAYNTAKLKHPSLATAMTNAGQDIRSELGDSIGIINKMRTNGGKPPVF